MQNLLKSNPITQLRGVYCHRCMTYSWSTAYKIDIRTHKHIGAEYYTSVGFKKLILNQILHQPTLLFIYMSIRFISFYFFFSRFSKKPFEDRLLDLVWL